MTALNKIDDDGVLEWLLDGDPAIRWQVMRDLPDALRPLGVVTLVPEQFCGPARHAPWRYGAVTTVFHCIKAAS